MGVLTNRQITQEERLRVMGMEDEELERYIESRNCDLMEAREDRRRLSFDQQSGLDWIISATLTDLEFALKEQAWRECRGPSPMATGRA